MSGMDHDPTKAQASFDEVPHDAPGAPALLDAVASFLRDDVLPVTDGRIAFHVRVAANVVELVARQLVLGPAQAQRHRRRLAEMGVDDDGQLAEAIRAGLLDDRLDEVRAAVRESVADKLAVANPSYIDGV